eukprot:TRINITY_DN6435_c1_g1_i1.p1 TRINITY_DN6435_c1_g1~~TRINITY_DN6435_c1_g1_i1.p1  ORF type:complete len:703 (-),score=159.91 TRINITY_DN6435_c1_g1_i1:35-2083(-)
MSQAIRDVFERKSKENKTVFVAFVTAGFPTREETVSIMLGLEKGGADIIELGVPHSDPLAEGPTIQHSSDVALQNGVTPQICLDYVKAAREAGLKAPIILMGYYNPLCAFGEEKFVQAARQAGANGFIIVDLPMEEASGFRTHCKTHDMSLIPLVAMTTTNSRLKLVDETADSFVYCISVLGVTGARGDLPAELPQYIDRVKQHVKKPLAVGFGVSSQETFTRLSQLGQGVVVGSYIVKALEKAAAGTRAQVAEETARYLTAGAGAKSASETTTNSNQVAPTPAIETVTRLPDRFGEFGGRYAPETLTAALDELELSYARLKSDPSFQAEVASYATYVGRPTSLYFADRLSKECGGAQIWLKREDLAHTGAHKINNALGQALLAKRLGKTRIIAETGAGQHGVATATVCAKLGLKCFVYMGSKDIERQSLNVFRMKILGATVVPVESGSKTLKDAVNEAMRDWVTNITDTHYIVGSAIGPHPFPTIVRDFQSIIGKEMRQQMIERTGRLPDYVLACVGGGSNAIGSFHPFIEDKDVKLVGIEAAGHGLDSDQHCATLVKGTPGVLHGTRTMIMQDPNGQISETHSISAGLDYPGVGPEHAWLMSTGRAQYVGVDDKQALDGLLLLSKTEGIIPALETSHAIYHAAQLAKTLPATTTVLVTVSGRGDKDMGTVAGALGVSLKS